MMRSAVDLPHPEGPRSETNSPARTSRSKRSSARTPLAKFFSTPRKATIREVLGELFSGGAGNGAPCQTPVDGRVSISFFDGTAYRTHHKLHSGFEAQSTILG